MLKPNKNVNQFLVILLVDKPNMANNGLYSVLLAQKHYKHIKLVVVNHKFEIQSRFIEYYDKGLSFSESINDIIKTSKENLVVILKDTDALHPLYFQYLNMLYKENELVNSYYCNFIKYNPQKETFITALRSYQVDTKEVLNTQTKPMAASNFMIGQLSWRTSCNKIYKCWFNQDIAKDKGKYFLERLSFKTGQTECADCVGLIYGGKQTVDTSIYPSKLPDNLEF